MADNTFCMCACEESTHGVGPVTSVLWWISSFLFKNRGVWEQKPLVITSVPTDQSVVCTSWVPPVLCEQLNKPGVYVLLGVAHQGLVSTPDTVCSFLRSVSSNTSHRSFNFCVVYIVFVFHMLQDEQLTVGNIPAHPLGLSLCLSLPLYVWAASWAG